MTSAVALSGLPNFTATPTPSSGNPGLNHQCTIHLNSESMGQIHAAYLDAQQGIWSRRLIGFLTIKRKYFWMIACHPKNSFFKTPH